jgi:hypothetical protein
MPQCWVPLHMRQAGTIAATHITVAMVLDGMIAVVHTQTAAVPDSTIAVAYSQAAAFPMAQKQAAALTNGTLTCVPQCQRSR